MPNLAQVIYQSYRECPERAAIHLLDNRQIDHRLSYRELFERAAGFSAALQQAGVIPGDVTVLLLTHSEALVTAFWGCLLFGSVPAIMPFLTEKLSPDHYRQALSALMEITRPTAIITYPQFAGEVERAVDNQESPSVTSILIADHIAAPETPNIDQLPGLQRKSAEIALLQHSSGTTGLQKGVALSHQAIFNQVDSYAQAIALSQQDCIVSWLPLYHDMGLIAGFIMPVLSRVPLVLISPFDWVKAPYKLMQAVTQYHGTLTWLPNFAFNFCAQKIRDRDLQNVDLHTWRAVINCSEPMVWSSHQLFRERFSAYGLRPEALATCYAMAENVFAVTQGGLKEPVRVDEIDPVALSAHQTALPATDPTRAIKKLSAGRPIRGTRLRILDNQGQDLPDRQVGEIALRSDYMLSEYYHRPDLTAQAFLDGWYLTGDLGYRVDGELFVTGRKKDLIIVGGKNIYPQDLERLACEVPGIHPGRAVAFGIFNEASGTEEVVLVAETDAPLDQDQNTALADAIRRQVTQGSDIALRYVQIVERNWLLKTSSGKIARLANRDKYLQSFRPMM